MLHGLYPAAVPSESLSRLPLHSRLAGCGMIRQSDETCTVSVAETTTSRGTTKRDCLNVRNDTKPYWSDTFTVEKKPVDVAVGAGVGAVGAGVGIGVWRHSHRKTSQRKGGEGPEVSVTVFDQCFGARDCVCDNGSEF